MSAILLTLGEKFAILCGETNLCLDSGGVGRIEKINMVEDKFLYGFTGRTTSAIEFFEKLIDNKLRPTAYLKSISFEQVLKILDNKFELYKEQGMEEDFDVCSILCGPIGERIQCVRYLIKPTECRREVYIAENEIRVVASCLDKHLENYKIDFAVDNLIEEIVDAFQKMVNKGIEFDETINNEVIAYFINKGVDRPYITQRLK